MLGSNKKAALNAISLSVVLLLILTASGSGQNFPTVMTTVAGGFQGTTPALRSGVNPTGVAIDSNGNIFIADELDRVIRKVDSSGAITLVAGNGVFGLPGGDNGSATSAVLTDPTLVVVDISGNLFIGDGSRVRRVDHITGTITAIAGNDTCGFSGDGGPATSATICPSALAIDASGDIFIADFSNNRIRRIDHATQIITTVAGNGSSSFSGDGGPATSAGINPKGVAIDTLGNIFVGDFGNSRVRRVDHSTQVITTVAGNGTCKFSGDGGAATSASLCPFRVAVDGNGNVFIEDLSLTGFVGQGPIIREVDHVSQVINTAAGNGAFGFSGDGGPATKAELSNVSDLTTDSSGNLYLATPTIAVSGGSIISAKSSRP
jgi:trimeric autotransporter adhesin